MHSIESKRRFETPISATAYKRPVLGEPWSIQNATNVGVRMDVAPPENQMPIRPGTIRTTSAQPGRLSSERIVYTRVVQSLEFLDNDSSPHIGTPIFVYAPRSEQGRLRARPQSIDLVVGLNALNERLSALKLKTPECLNLLKDYRLDGFLMNYEKQERGYVCVNVALQGPTVIKNLYTRGVNRSLEPGDQAARSISSISRHTHTHARTCIVLPPEPPLTCSCAVLACFVDFCVFW